MGPASSDTLPAPAKGILEGPVGRAYAVDEPVQGPIEPPAPPPRGSRETILAALGDPLSRAILVGLADAPQPARELLRRVDVPQSTLYRRLAEMRAAGLIDVQRAVISEDGKRTELFRSRVEEVVVHLHGPTLDVKVRRRDLSAARLAELWNDVRNDGGP